MNSITTLLEKFKSETYLVHLCTRVIYGNNWECAQQALCLSCMKMITGRPYVLNCHGIPAISSTRRYLLVHESC